MKQCLAMIGWFFISLLIFKQFDNIFILLGIQSIAVFSYLTLDEN